MSIDLTGRPINSTNSGTTPKGPFYSTETEGNRFSIVSKPNIHRGAATTITEKAGTSIPGCH